MARRVASAKAKSVKKSVTRGPESWAYVCMALGFTLIVEGIVISMVDAFVYPWNVVAYVVVGGVTYWLFTDSAWFQDKMLAKKLKFEGGSR